MLVAGDAHYSRSPERRKNVRWYLLVHSSEVAVGKRASPGCGWKTPEVGRRKNQSPGLVAVNGSVTKLSPLAQKTGGGSGELTGD